MNRRLITCAAALYAAAFAAAAHAQPATLRYAVGTGHFRLESQQHVEQEMMGQSTKVDLTTAMLLTVAVDDAAGNLGVGITVDSIEFTLPAGVPPEASSQLASIKGTTLHLVTTPQGQPVSSMQADSVSPATRQVTAGLREFLPQLPRGSLAAGTTWSDTTTSAPQGQSGPTRHTTRQFRVVGWEDHQGARALHLAVTTAYTVTGSSEAQGQTIELSGGGQGTADAFVSASGLYLGGTAADSSLVNASIVAAGMIIPVRTTTHSTVTRLP